MKIELDDNKNIDLKEVFSGILMQTAEGNQIGICMRDDAFEFNVMPKGIIGHNWYRINMETVRVCSMMPKKVINVHDPEGGDDG